MSRNQHHRAAWSLEWGDGSLVVSWEAGPARVQPVAPQEGEDPRRAREDDREDGDRWAGWRAAAARWWGGTRARGRVARPG